MKRTISKTKRELQSLNETGKRKINDRRQASETPKAQMLEQRKGNRRRQIDPTTCEREYTDLEVEFMHAMDEYKRLSGRMFPTCSEVLEVLMKLGYRKVAEPQVIYQPASPPA